MLLHFRRAIGEEHSLEVCSRSHYVDTDMDWKARLRTVGKSMRYNLTRRVSNLFEEYDCRFHLIENADELEPAMDALVELHQARWQSKDEQGVFALPGVEEFMKEAMRASFTEGRLRL